MSKTPQDAVFVPLRVAVATVSDRRGEKEDTSGQLLAEAAEAAGHKLVERAIVGDDLYRIRALVSRWIAEPVVQVVLINGGTGSGRRDNCGDCTPAAVAPLFDRALEGFGELFRSLSFDQIGTATLQSRALAGVANGSLIFCLPGSPRACRLAWDGILREQLDARTRPCNFAGLYATAAQAP